MRNHPMRIILHEEEDNEIEKKRGEEKKISLIDSEMKGFEIVMGEGEKLSKPRVYFNEKNSFLKSYLYLTDMIFYENCHLPGRSNQIIDKFMKKISEELIGKSRGKGKKLMQTVINYGISNIDTDPKYSFYFSDLYDILFTKRNKHKIVVLESDEYFYHKKTIPNKIPKLYKEKTENICYIFLYLPNGRFCPYGISYLK
jgi:hypothetical protein